MRKIMIIGLAAILLSGCTGARKLLKDTVELTIEKKKISPPVRVYNPVPRSVWPKIPNTLTVRIPMNLEKGNLVRVFVGQSGNHEVKWVDPRGKVCNVFWTGHNTLEGYTAAWTPYGSYKTLYIVLYERCDKCPGYFKPTVFSSYEDVALVPNTRATWVAPVILSKGARAWQPITELPEGVRVKVAASSFQ